MSARFDLVHEVKEHNRQNEWTLCLQYGCYFYDDGSDSQEGYRFIWRRPDGTLQAARGQARIPSIPRMLDLISKAIKEDWGNLDGDA